MPKEAKTCRRGGESEARETCCGAAKSCHHKGGEGGPRGGEPEAEERKTCHRRVAGDQEEGKSCPRRGEVMPPSGRRKRKRGVGTRAERGRKPRERRGRDHHEVVCKEAVRRRRLARSPLVNLKKKGVGQNRSRRERLGPVVAGLGSASWCACVRWACR